MINCKRANYLYHYWKNLNCFANKLPHFMDNYYELNKEGLTYSLKRDRLELKLSLHLYIKTVAEKLIIFLSSKIQDKQ